MVAQNLEYESDVVGGTIEPDYQFPWVVDVGGTLTGKGVLIAPTWVLTAAHNVATSFSGARVSYRRTDPTGRATAGSQNTAAGSIKLHPNYVTGSPDFDLALVRLPTPFPPDPYLQPAALPIAAAAIGQSGTVASNSHTTTLPAGHVAVLRGPIILIGGMTVIARSPTASLCPGDSGSGFVMSNGSANVVVGIAVQTHVDDCTKPNIEFDAVDVFKHLDWIRSTVGIFNAEIYSTDGSGGIARLRGHSNWRDSWHSIVPGDFGGDGHTDLLFYDRSAGIGEFYTTDGSGGITLLRSQPNWRTTWDIIVPGDFGGSGRTDLLFYDRETGTGQFYATDGGAIHELRTYTNWRTSWDSIIPGDFGGDGHTDLLFYNRSAGVGEFYTTDGSGGITLLRSQPNWRTTWDIIVPGDFEGSGRTDLLFYDRETGTGQFYATDGGAIHELRTYTNWRTSWDSIIPGDFGGDCHTDLLFYNRSAGVGEFYTTDGSGGITLLRSHTNWRTTWDIIVPGKFGGDDRTDLLFYERHV